MLVSSRVIYGVYTVCGKDSIHEFGIKDRAKYRHNFGSDLPLWCSIQGTQGVIDGIKRVFGSFQQDEGCRQV